MNNPSILDQLKNLSVVVVDSGDIDSVTKYQPIDVTTNPSLLLLAVETETYQLFIEDAISYSKNHKHNLPQREALYEKLLVNSGIGLLDIISGRVSVELNAKLAFDSQASIDTAKRIINLFEESHYSRERVLIKIPATWEGIKAAEQLQKDNINCNLTLVFSMTQAIACAEANVKLISPFVGRVLDWYKTCADFTLNHISEDPGVILVTQIFNYYKSNSYQTEIMAASFRNIEQIKQLSGCDLLTIAPSLLTELEKEQGVLEQNLNSKKHCSDNKNIVRLSEKDFRWELNENTMANEKLSDGIRRFNADTQELLQFLEI